MNSSSDESKRSKTMPVDKLTEVGVASGSSSGPKDRGQDRGQNQDRERDQDQKRDKLTPSSAEGSDALAHSLGGLSPVEQQELTDILDRYLQRIENGQPVDPDLLMKEHPRYAPMLRRYLDSLGVLHHAARGIHNGSEPQLAFPSTMAKERRLGDYEIRRQIGRGGMGIVYEARQVSLDRRVALKVLPLAAVLDKRQIARFRREAQAAAQLHHPNIVPVFGVGCEQGVHFYSMQLVEGQSLDRVIGSLIGSDPSFQLTRDQISRDLDVTRDAASSQGSDSKSSTVAGIEECTTSMRHESTVEEPVDESAEENAECSLSGASISQSGSICDRNYVDQVAKLGIQAASALQQAHDYGVIHRDIKPSNLMLDREGQLWVTDFGLAYIQSETDMTATGDLVGTLRYMSPEQASGSIVVDQRTDVYSLGVTLYELLTLKQAIPTKERAQLLRDIETLEPKGLRRINATIPRDLETIILKAISKDRDQRYSQAQDFADDLQRYLDGKPTLARRPTLVDLGTKWAYRHRALVTSSVLALIVALGITSAALFSINQEQSRTLAAKNAMNEQRVNAIATLEQILNHTRGLSKQPRIQREIQLEARELFQQFVNNKNTPFIELAETYNRIGGMSDQLGDFQAAAGSYRSAGDAYRQLADESQGTATTKVDSRPIEEVALRRMEAVSLNNLGQALTRIGDHDGAAEAYTSALVIFESLDSSSLQFLDLSNRDQSSDEQSNSDEQSMGVQQGVALVTGNLGHLASKTGDRQSAIDYINRAIVLREQLLDADPQNTGNQIRLASNYHNLSSLVVDQDPSTAEELCRRAIGIQEQIVKRIPSDIRPRTDLVLSWNNLGSIALRRRAFTEAAESFELAVQAGRRLVKEAPEIPQLRHDLAISYNHLGETRAAEGDLDAALLSYERAGEQFEILLPHFSDDPVALARYGGVLYNQAVVYKLRKGSDLTHASSLFEKAIAIQKKSVDLAPRAKQYARLLDLSLSKYATFLQQIGDEEQLAKIRDELARRKAARTATLTEAQHAN